MMGLGGIGSLLDLWMETGPRLAAIGFRPALSQSPW